MTIDEAITRERKIAKEQRSHIGTWYSKIMGYDDEYIKKCEVCAEEHEQITEWLEELKELRATSCGYSKEDIELNRNAMYNKAIDDFVKECICYEHLTFEQEHIERIQAIAENCEKRHCKPIEIVKCRYLSIDNNMKGYPIEITVRMADGTEQKYKR